MDPSRRDASSTSPSRPSRNSHPPASGSSTSASPGDEGAPPIGLGLGDVRALAARHAVRPDKAFGQNFLIDPNLARAIAMEAGARPGRRVVEVGAGLGSLTVALAATGADVVAIEFDRALLPALHEVTRDLERVRVVAADALHVAWSSTLSRGPWTMCSSLPYNVAVPLIVDMLERAPMVGLLVVVVQHEVGERLIAGPGDDAYGALSLRVAFRAEVKLLRRVPADVFWPRPKVESVVVRLDRLERPRVDVDAEWLFAVVDAGFAERRKTMRNAVRRLVGGSVDADSLLRDCGIAERARAQELSLDDFARIAGALG